MTRLTVERVEREEANAFVVRHHRHMGPVIGHLFALGAALDGEIVGVAIVGRPVSRMRDDGVTVEVTRLATDGTRNACSFLYGACARAAFALGYKRNRNLHFVDGIRRFAARRRLEENSSGARALVVDADKAAVRPTSSSIAIPLRSRPAGLTGGLQNVSST